MSGDVTLGELPKLAPLIGRAALTSRGRPGAKAGLPGRTYTVPSHAQDPVRLAAYDRVCGFPLADAVPATWLHVLTFPLQAALIAADDFPFPLVGLIHVTNEMTLSRPVTVGDTLRLAVRAENLAEHRRGNTFDMVGEAYVGDELAWTGRSTYLARRPDSRTSGDKGGAAGEQPRPGPARPDAAASAVVGEGPGADAAAVPSQVWRLPANLGQQYAAVSGDVNPLHLHALPAKLFGFPRAIIHGMWTHARALAAFGGRLPETYTVGVEFTKPILLPGTVGFAAAAAADGGHTFAVTRRDGTKPYLKGRLH